jgi:hypothetical protein
VEFTLTVLIKRGSHVSFLSRRLRKLSSSAKVTEIASSSITESAIIFLFVLEKGGCMIYARMSTTLKTEVHRSLKCTDRRAPVCGKSHAGHIGHYRGVVYVPRIQCPRGADGTPSPLMLVLPSQRIREGVCGQVLRGHVISRELENNRAPTTSWSALLLVTCHAIPVPRPAFLSFRSTKLLPFLLNVSNTPVNFKSARGWA